MNRWSIAAAVSAALLAAACGKGPSSAAEQAAETAGSNPSGQGGNYLRPPEILAVSAARDGGFLIRGKAEPEARIRAVTLSTDHKAYGATAGADGAFVLGAPPSSTPLLVALASEAGKHQVSAEGWLFIPPDAPSRAVVLRAGAPARPRDPAAGAFGAVDYDGGGGSVSGFAPPGAVVSVALDGANPLRARPDSHGMFAVRLGADRAVSPGSHEIRVSTGAQTSTRSLQFHAGSEQSLGGQTFSALREADGWRVVWTLPGGGAQTTFVPIGTERR